VAALTLVAAFAALVGCGHHDASLVTGSGMIEMDEVDVASQITGRILELRVDEGDSVGAGEVLAVLEQGQVVGGSGVGTAEAELQAAEAQYKLAVTEAKRSEKLYADRIIAAAELDRAHATRDAAAARLSAARSRIHEQTVKAPIAGVVLLRNFQVGELAAAGAPVVTLGDPDKLWMRIYVSAPQIPRVRRGDSVSVRVTGVARRFGGHVIEIATRAEFTPRVALTEEERANLVFGVKVRLDPSGGALKPGLPADATILTTVGEPEPPASGRRQAGP